MAGIDTLLKGAGTSFAKDKLSQYLSPTQMDFLSLALGPKAYLLNTGIDVLAKTLGYGNEYKELKTGAEDDKTYAREVARDIIGDMLPDSVGDVIRSTPRGDDSPAGMYYDSDVGDFVQSSNPVASSDSFAGDRFGGKYDQNSVFNTNSQNYVGPANPKDMDSSIYSGNLTDLLEMLNAYEAKAVPEIVTTDARDTVSDGSTFDADIGASVPVGDQAPAETSIDFGGTMDYSDIFGGGGGWGGGGGCPAPWVNLLMADGSLVNAGNIKPGMQVYTRHEITNEWGVYPVTAMEMGEDERWEVALEDGRTFVGTFNHRVHTGDDWTEIRNLKAGDKLVQPDGFGIVKSSKHLDHGPIVKITVDKAHTYISEGFLSHNMKFSDMAYDMQYAKGGVIPRGRR
jgi:hypothetical protein